MSEAGIITGTDAQLLQDFLRERDVPCPRCEYNLRNLVGTRCPECGDELTLRVNLTEPKLAAFLTGLVGLAAGAGFSGMLLLYGLWMILIQEQAGPDYWWPFMAITLGGLAGMGVPMLLWIRFRAALRRQAIARQWMLAMTCWVLSIANLIVFIKYIE